MLNEGAARLVLLDLGLPDVDGEEVLRAARAAGEVPVIVLTASSAAEDRIRGLTLGADDYVTKPFSPTEVVLRVQAVLHRAGRNGEEPGAVCYGGGRLRVDEDRHEAALDGRPLDLTPTEWGLLTALASVPGRVYSRYELVNRVRGYEFEGYERIIDSHVKNLRHKLGAGGRGSWRRSPASGTGWDCAVTRSWPLASPAGTAAARSVRPGRAVVGRHLDRGRPDRHQSGAVRGPVSRAGSRPPTGPPRRPPPLTPPRGGWAGALISPRRVPSPRARAPPWP